MPHHACPPSPPSVSVVSTANLCHCRAGCTYESLHSAVKRMSVVSPELGVGSLERWVSVRLWLLDTNYPTNISHILFCVLFHSACGRMLFLGVSRRGAWMRMIVHTRSCAPSSPGCAETSSLILCRVSATKYFAGHQFHILAIATVSGC